jgi:DeoR/GlpR family transcriptional regulator of sugar metabolism
MSPYDLILATNARSYSHAAEIRDQLATTEKRAIASTAAARVKEQYA